jgi:uncharacterized lipoprotein YmbA
MSQVRMTGLGSLVIALLAGCGSSPASFYTLSAGAEPRSTASAKDTAPYSIAVGPVTLPELVDRPQLVVRVAANRVMLSEQHRWAEPLKSEIPRVLAENLAQLLGTKRVSAYPQNTGSGADYRVVVDVQRFESAPGESATVEALWSVHRGADGQARTGSSVVREATDGKGYDALAAAHARALAQMSEQIADAIRALNAAPR